MEIRYKPPRPPFTDVTGQRFSRLLVLHLLGSHRSNVYFRCRCDCGTELDVMRQNLTSGRQKSCGCWVADHSSQGGDSARHPEYRVWDSMLRRCLNEKHPAYHHYGGRGIGVCQEWQDSFRAFLRDMGPRPSPKHSIERKNNDGNYEKGNCCWATTKEQAANRRPMSLHRRSRLLTHDGKTQTMAAWAREVGLTPQIIYRRLKSGWPLDRALQRADLRSEALQQAWDEGRRK